MEGKPAETDLLKPSEDCIFVLNTSRRSGFFSEMEGSVWGSCGGAEVGGLSEQNSFSSEFSKAVQILLKGVCFGRIKIIRIARFLEKISTKRIFLVGPRAE